MKIKVEEKKGGVLTNFIIAAVMFVSVSGGFLSASELNVSAKIPFGGILNGLKLICNQIFETSEKYQAYKYIRFMANPQESYILALLVIILAIAAFIMTAAKFKNMIMYAVIFIGFTGFQIYFGIFPSPVWNIAFYSSIALAAICGNRSIFNISGNLTLFLITLAAVCSLVYLNYSGANPMISELSENIRDRFDEKIQNPQSLQNQRNDVDITEQIQDSLQAQENFANPDDGNNNSEKYETEFEENFSGSQIGAAVLQGLLFVLIIIFIVILVFAARLLLIIIKAAKCKKQFDSPDCAFAVNLMFNYLMQFLAAFGLKPKNTENAEENIFEQYALQLKYIISPKYSEEYLEIAGIWLETAYSEHETTSETRRKMRLFLDKTPSLLIKNANLFMRIKIKIYLLCKYVNS